MAIIQLEDMEFYSYHGCFKEEQFLGSRFLVTLNIEADCTKAALTDNITDTINYHKVYQLVKTEMRKRSKLLENIANRILDSLYQNFKGIKKAKVKISKMNPPLGGHVKRVSVILER